MLYGNETTSTLEDDPYFNDESQQFERVRNAFVLVYDRCPTPAAEPKSPTSSSTTALVQSPRRPSAIRESSCGVERLVGLSAACGLTTAGACCSCCSVTKPRTIAKPWQAAATGSLDICRHTDDAISDARVCVRGDLGRQPGLLAPAIHL